MSVAAARPALSTLDRATLAWAAFSGVVLVMRLPDLPYAGLIVLAHVLLLELPFLAARARPAGRVGGFLGVFYPLLLTVALYTEIGLLNVARGVVHDVTVQGWELAVFGTQPSRAWIRAWPWPWLSNLLHGGYLSYYLILAGAPLGLWWRGQRAAAERVLLLMMATFYLCYTVFLLFPVAGPRYSWAPADNAATQALLARVTQDLLATGSAWGTAFPSSHVAVALVAAFAAGRAWPALGAVLIPASVLLTLGTVYGQLHYAVDAIAGAALAAVVLSGVRQT